MGLLPSSPFSLAPEPVCTVPLPWPCISVFHEARANRGDPLLSPGVPCRGAADGGMS